MTTWRHSESRVGTSIILACVLVLVSCAVIQKVADWVWYCALDAEYDSGRVCSCEVLGREYYKIRNTNQMAPCDGAPPAPPVPDGPAIVQECDVAYLRTFGGGYTDKPSQLYACLERHSVVIATSVPIRLDSGAFYGYAIKVPLNGVELDTSEYTMSFYYAEEDKYSLLPQSSYYRAIDVHRLHFTESEIAHVKSLPKLSIVENTEKKGGYKCMFVGDTLHLKVAFDDPYEKKYHLDIVEGVNSDPEIIWSVQGYAATALLPIGDGVFEALYPAEGQDDLFVVATHLNGDTSWLHWLADTFYVSIFDTTGQTTPCTNGHFHARVWRKYDGDLTAASADMRCDFVRLCGDGYSTEQANSLAKVSIAYDTNIVLIPSGDTIHNIWGQVGFVNLRYAFGPSASDSNPELIIRSTYCEVEYNNPRSWLRLNPQLNIPQNENEVHNFAVTLDPVTGMFTFWADGVDFRNESFPVWQGVYPDYVEFAGEITESESDMFGTIDDPCFIANFRATLNGQNMAIPMSDLEFKGDDTTEWNYEMINDTFFFWDEHPLP